MQENESEHRRQLQQQQMNATQEGELEKCLSPADRFLNSSTAKGIVQMALEAIRSLKAKTSTDSSGDSSSGEDDSSSSAYDDIPKIPISGKRSR
jgi:hypothetical protein